MEMGRYDGNVSLLWQHFPYLLMHSYASLLSGHYFVFKTGVQGKSMFMLKLDTSILNQLLISFQQFSTIVHYS